MIANFYYEASPIAVIVGTATAIGLVVALGFTKRPLLSGVASGGGCGAIAFCVWACGHGDIVGLFYLVIAVLLAAILGGLAGLASAAMVRRRNQVRKGSPDRSKQHATDAS